jgi:hypothetical protein
VAISADDRRVEPLAIKAAIRRIQRNSTGERLMAELAAPVMEERLFNLLVENYCDSRQQSTPAVPASSPRRPMQGVARLPVAA